MRTSLGEKKKYLIGDVAQIVGISRDALRFYEKKGVIQAEKKENGYRYYSEDDIYKLLYVVYHRKMNVSLKEIEALMDKGREDTVEFMQDYLSGAIEKEKKEIKNHTRIIARLKLKERDMKNIAAYMGKYTLKDFPKSYVLGEYDSFEEGMESWFQMAGTADGMDMAYFYTEFSLKGDKPLVKGTKLLFYKELEKYMDMDFKMPVCRETRTARCIYTVEECKGYMPDVECIGRLFLWGRKNGLETEKTVYVNNLTSCSLNDTPRYFTEIYLPVKESLEI